MHATLDFEAVIKLHTILKSGVHLSKTYMQFLKVAYIFQKLHAIFESREQLSKVKFRKLKVTF